MKVGEDKLFVIIIVLSKSMINRRDTYFSTITEKRYILVYLRLQFYKLDDMWGHIHKYLKLNHSVMTTFYKFIKN